MVEYLLKECKVDKDVQDFSGDTALHDAARFGHTKVCSILKNNGVDTSIKNKAGHTAYDVAVEHGYAKVAEILHTNSTTRSKL
jgi:ankyrin repeat protein